MKKIFKILFVIFLVLVAIYFILIAKIPGWVCLLILFSLFCWCYAHLCTYLLGVLGIKNLAKDEKEIKAEEMEQDDPCIRCDGPSGEKKSTSVDQRKHYVEGAGQLCPKCYEFIYD